MVSAVGKMEEGIKNGNVVRLVLKRGFRIGLAEMVTFEQNLMEEEVKE